MKKTLLAVALLAGYAGAASAQSKVTLYGVVDIGLNYQMIKPGKAAADLNSADKTNSQFGLASGQQSSSRWGLKGVEDLGNGLKANFVYESGITANTGASTNFTRQSTLGLTSTSWGAIDLGRRSAPSTQAFSGIDPFAASFGTASTTTVIGTNFYRLSNMVMYSTPSMSGFSANVGYSFDTGLTTEGAPVAKPSFGNGYKTKAVSVGLRYANGPILASATYDSFNSNGFRGAEKDASEKPGNVNIWAVGGTYDFKVVKVHAAYSQSTGGVLNNLSTITSVADGGDTNAKGNLQFYPGSRTSSWMAGLSAPVGAAGKVFGSVQQKIVGGSLKDLQTANELVASIGYTYSMSKRTNVYAYYSYVDNAAMVQDASVNTIGLGLRHLF
jgi:general bacterial porin, GBP family